MHDGNQVLRFENKFKASDLGGLGVELTERKGTGNYDKERTKFNFSFVPLEKSTLKEQVYSNINKNKIYYNDSKNVNLLNGAVVTSGKEFFQTLGMNFKPSGRKIEYRKNKGEDILIPDIKDEKDIPEKVKTFFKDSYDFLEDLVGKENIVYAEVHYDEDTKESVSRSLAKELSNVLKIDEDKVALVVGLGNWNVTPDSLGPKVVSKIMITRHLKELVPDEIDEGIRPVCAISPGVLGITGMETGEIVKGIVERVKPDVLICIDALASRRLNRVNTTIQIGTSGIAPGAGVGNKRKELSEKTLGIPVIAIGVPTVVDAATMASDTIDLVIDDLIRESTKDGDFYKILKGIDREDKHKLISALLTPEVGDLIVTPKEVDDVIESISKIIANGINIALQPALELSDINRYLN